MWMRKIHFVVTPPSPYAPLCKNQIPLPSVYVIYGWILTILQLVDGSVHWTILAAKLDNIID